MEAEPAACVPVHCRCVPHLGHRPGGHLLQLPVHGGRRSQDPRSKGHPSDPRLPQRPIPAGEADAPLAKAGRQGGDRELSQGGTSERLLCPKWRPKLHASGTLANWAVCASLTLAGHGFLARDPRRDVEEELVCSACMQPSLSPWRPPDPCSLPYCFPAAFLPHRAAGPAVLRVHLHAQQQRSGG